MRLKSEQNFSHLSALIYISGYDLRGLRLRGRGQRGSQLLRDCVPREHRGRQQNGHVGFQSRTCSASLARRERLES